MPRKRTRTHEVREKKDDSTVRGNAPKRRNEVVRDMLTPEGRPGRAGPHKNKGQRGQGQKGKGKGQRHPKHKGRAYQASAARYLEAAKPGIVEGPKYNQWIANQAFVDAVRRRFSDVIMEGSPRGGYVVFSDDGQDDVYVSPYRDRAGWYELNVAASSRANFIKQIGKAVGVRVASEDEDMADGDKKDDTSVRGKTPKRRNEVVRDMLTPEGRPGRAGPHKNKGQRGRGTKGKGKGQRHPKHKGRAYQASATRVAARYIEARTAPRLEKKGRRYYIYGDTYAFRGMLKTYGAHWDRDERAWWVSTQAYNKYKREIDELVEGMAIPRATKKQKEYLYRLYSLLGQSPGNLDLVTMEDASERIDDLKKQLKDRSKRLAPAPAQRSRGRGPAPTSRQVGYAMKLLRRLGPDGWRDTSYGSTSMPSEESLKNMTSRDVSILIDDMKDTLGGSRYY